jgi:hypothetical protein
MVCSPFPGGDPEPLDARIEERLSNRTPTSPLPKLLVTFKHLQHHPRDHIIIFDMFTRHVLLMRD